MLSLPHILPICNWRHIYHHFIYPVLYIQYIMYGFPKNYNTKQNIIWGERQISDMDLEYGWNIEIITLGIKKKPIVNILMGFNGKSRQYTRRNWWCKWWQEMMNAFNVFTSRLDWRMNLWAWEYDNIKSPNWKEQRRLKKNF